VSTRSAPARASGPGLAAMVGLVVGLGVTAASMSSGFIWASQGEVALVYVAGFFSWTGYAFAHYAVVGEFVDDVSEDEDSEVDEDSEEDEDSDEDEDSGEDDDSGEEGVSGEDQATGENGERREDGDRSGGALGAAVADLRAIVPSEPHRAVGFLAGIAVLVAGIAILAWYVRQENHLLGNLGSGMFLGGYVVAHYFDAGKLL